ncbi:tRNA pseudouridine(55) synthase TruB [Sandaracinobacteroides saxicola]|uniref:tRNA pseudouridine synthase B n=1 Tax=Sandaracinobacteroides saxicola TaxID=2759707 RepID=A0A7G5II46_9SPHN|nr:tRNA pseudouridine(55) synthase TruB [Sandaracinobacteroides saxicola]QMW23038.1 tRNA pseudouridine(55) synthase TruB [Sandaracinobacteroides saxicola]
MPHGWLVIDKPLGLTSAQVVGRLKHAMRGSYGKVKIGHGGTLDPLATGVLPVALGEATKLAGHLLNGRKGYAFTVAFGVATATDDAKGAVTATSAVRPDEATLRAVLPQFTGPIRQRPPAYSALKVDGERAYARARAGEDVVLAERAVTIDALTLEAVTADSATFVVTCSKGTYVRSLARDIALAAGTVGHVSMLRRTEAGRFGLAQAIVLDRAVALCHGAALGQALLPLSAGLDDIPVLVLEPHEATLLKSGRRLPGPRAKPGTYLATLGSVPVALVAVSALDVRVERGFNLEGDPDVGHC